MLKVKQDDLGFEMGIKMLNSKLIYGWAKSF
jgi:hypothetical protein